MGNKESSKSAKEKNNRVRRFELRLTEAEREQFLLLEKTLGMNRSEIVRLRVLSQSSKVLVDSKAILRMLDELGAELGRSGNNINQLAKHANTLKIQGKLEPSDLSGFPHLISQYLKYQQMIALEFRSLMRLIKGQR